MRPAIAVAAASVLALVPLAGLARVEWARDSRDLPEVRTVEELRRLRPVRGVRLGGAIVYVLGCVLDDGGAVIAESAIFCRWHDRARVGFRRPSQGCP